MTTTVRAYSRRMQDSISSIAGLNIVIGALVFLTPFFTIGSVASLWTNVIAGLAIMGLAAYNLFVAVREHPEDSTPTATINLLIGAYVALSPLWLAVGATFAGTNVLLGLLLVAMAGYNVYAGTESRRRARTHQ